MMKMRIVIPFLVVLLVMFLSPQVNLFAQGLLIPQDKSLDPLVVKSQFVDSAIRDQVAKTKITQVFQNNYNRDLEATYIFPIPKDASLTDFALYINGKRVSGEVLEKDKARQIYQDIVRRMKDPGLLEYLDSTLLRVSIYPVPARGEQKVELEYNQIVPVDNNLFEYILPLKADKMASSQIQNFSVKVDLRSNVPIKNIFSPSHDVGISKKDEYHAIIGFEKSKTVFDKDFLLYYSVDKADVGMSMLTYRVGGEDGYFLLLMSPRSLVDESRQIPKDIVFVIDTSGSMQGKKIEQAKKALTFCVNALSENDRFNIVRFSTDIDVLNTGELLEATSGNKEQAVSFIDKMNAVGGTDINSALIEAFSMRGDVSDRPFQILFLTDGIPTVGETDIAKILANVKDKNVKTSRIFSFGVGYDVNTNLLDELQVITNGANVYVKPEEDLELKISNLYSKISKPVLTDVKVSMDDAHPYDMYPKELPDLFAGGQLVLLGRYSNSGSFPVDISGMVGDERKEYPGEATFVENDASNDFIPKLWATRKIAYLIGEIKLHGENKELKDEIIRLGKKFAIATPYTSYLVIEEGERLTRTARESAPMTSAFPSTSTRQFDLQRKKMGSAGPGEMMMQEEHAYSAGMKTPTGQKSVEMSRELSRLKESTDYEALSYAQVKMIDGKTFYDLSGVWVDDAFRDGMDIIKVKFGSDAYFALYDKLPDYKGAFQLGENILIVLKGKAVFISGEGTETLTDELKELLP